VNGGEVGQPAGVPASPGLAAAAGGADVPEAVAGLAGDPLGSADCDGWVADGLGLEADVELAEAAALALELGFAGAGEEPDEPRPTCETVVPLPPDRAWPVTTSYAETRTAASANPATVIASARRQGNLPRGPGSCGGGGGSAVLPVRDVEVRPPKTVMTLSRPVRSEAV
jgi:hypothetical protein